MFEAPELTVGKIKIRRSFENGEMQGRGKIQGQAVYYAYTRGLFFG